VDLLAVFIPKSRHHSFHRDYLLFRQKTTFFAAAQLQTYRGRASLDARKISLAGYTATAFPRPSAAF
jgi:hypothetical protein